jgi:hypothetical protein
MVRFTIKVGNIMNNQNQAFNVDWSTVSAPLQELQKINQETSEKVTREFISYWTDCTGTAMKCAQTMPRITSPEDFVNTQIKIYTQQLDNFLEFSQNVCKIYQDAIKDNARWSEDKVNTAFKTATVKAKKSAEEH